MENQSHQEDEAQAPQSMEIDMELVHVQEDPESDKEEVAKKRRRPLRSDIHNTDCECSTHSSEEDDEQSQNKRQRIQNVMSSTPTRQRKEVDLRPEVLCLLSPRSIHRTLMESVNLDEISDLSCSSISLLDDSDSRPYQPFQPVEYQLRAFSPSLENPNPIENMSSSTEDEEDAELGIRRIRNRSSSSDSSHFWEQDAADLNNFADESSDSDSDSDYSRMSGGRSSDSELSEKDKWLCNNCNAKTNNAYFRYCLRCFNIRRNWLPNRHKKTPKPRPPPKVHQKRARADYTLTTDGTISVPRTTPEDERTSSRSSSKAPSSFPSSSQSTPSRQETGANENNRAIPGPSQGQALSLKLQSTLDAPPVSVAAATGARDDPLCIICMAREKNSAFVHGKTAHFCCCFTCGDKIIKRTGQCPICRRKILRVVKIII